jgi:hypothetical protein
MVGDLRLAATAGACRSQAEGHLMPSHNKTGRNKKGDRHVRIHHWRMQTAAWKALSGDQRAIYIEMAARYRGPGSNNGYIPYSVREAALSLHIGKSSAARDLESLQEKGFIRPTQKGAFSLKVRHATEWRLTEFPCDLTNALPSKEFARWSSEIQNTVPPQNGTVPVAGLAGTCGGTDQMKTTPDGTWGGTVNEISANPRYPQRDTISLPGGSRWPSSAWPGSYGLVCLRRIKISFARRYTISAVDLRNVEEMKG